MSQQSELVRRLRRLTAERRDEFLSQLDSVTRGTRSAPLTFRQEQIWLLDRVAPSSKAYGLGFTVNFQGSLDVQALEAALNDVIDRHTVLRSVFPHEHETGEQVVLTPSRVELVAEDSPQAIPSSVRELVREELRQGFDLNIESPVRFRLLRVSAGEHVLVIVTHYLAMDPRSAATFGADLVAAYQGRSGANGQPFATAAREFGEYAVWQREWSAGAEAERAVEHWHRTLAGWENTELPVDRPRPRVFKPDCDVVESAVAVELVERVRERACELGVNVRDILLATYFALIARQTAGTDLTIGVPHQVFGPFAPDTLLGDCGNILPIRVEIDTRSTFTELVHTVCRQRSEAEKYGTLPFRVILDRLQIEPDTSRIPLVQLGFDTPAAKETFRAHGLGIELEQVDTGTGTFELALEAVWDAPDPAIRVRYATELYYEDTAVRVAERYLRLLEDGCRSPHRPVSSLAFASEEEVASITRVWNSEIGTYEDTTVHQQFESVAAEHGDRVAIGTTVGETTTYAELDRWANQIAHRLVDHGVQPGSLVAVMVERGPEMVAAMLGVLKAGAAYVPIDLTNPADRVAAIIDNCGAKTALASASTAQLLGDQVTIVDSGGRRPDAPETGPDIPTRPESLAYVIYTSGSTGAPKGVQVEHRNVTNFARTVRAMFRLGPHDRIPQFNSPGYDVSVFEIFGTLLAGAYLHIVSAEERTSIDAVDALMTDQRITVIDLPPAIMELLTPERYRDLRVAFVGGEAFTGELTTRWAQQCEFHNGYGPTETTVTVVDKKCEGTWTESPPIGRAMANHRAYVVDETLGLLPPGAVGELAISGLGVARGYLGRPDLTADRFRPDPYGPPGSRMYLTGDLAMWRADGELTYLGRADRQVKVRGVRIELGEVEAALQGIDGVSRAVADVATDPYRGKLLVAYVVGEEGTELQLDVVRAALGSRLPSSMVPNVLVPLAEVPLTQSGKVDRRALPAVEFAVPDVSESDDENLTPTERTVRDEVFRPLLGASIGGHSNFFAAGGTSLQAIRVASKVKEVFGIEVPIAEFFAEPTIAGLARLVDRTQEQDHQHLDEEIAELAKNERV